MSDDASNSSYPPLIAPQVQSQIPTALLEGATPQSRYILDTLSILTQKADFHTHAVLDLSTQVRATNGKLKKARSDIDDIQIANKVTRASVGAGWKMLCIITGALMGAAGLLIEIIRIMMGI